MYFIQKAYFMVIFFTKRALKIRSNGFFSRKYY